MAARGVLMLLLWHADAHGRTWLGIQTIASKTGAGNLRTVRNALDGLVRDGWLQSTPQTWASLTAEQTAAGRPVPRRGDVGQAPNLYILLDGRGNPVTSTPGVQPPSTPTRPGLARAPIFVCSPQESTQGPGQIGQGGPSQIGQGGPLADLPHDLDPRGSPSKIMSVEQPARFGRSTHHFSNVREKGQAWLDAWNVIVEVHADKTKSVYGLPPLPPDLKREQQKVLAECLDGAALDVGAKFRDRTGIERDVADVRRELTLRVMQLYFKRDNEHLRKVKHALRDLPREFHARITEAMQLLLRESHDATPTRNQQLEQTPIRPDKPIEVVRSRPVESSPSASSAQVITAREARRIVEVLSGVSAAEIPMEQRKTDAMPASRPTMPIQADDVVVAQEHHKPNQDNPHADKLVSGLPPALHQSSAGRAGAPRWGGMSPRPMKVRYGLRQLFDDVEVEAGAIVESSPTKEQASPRRKT